MSKAKLSENENMHSSFYDTPRLQRVPIVPEKLPIKPVVPEVSIISPAAATEKHTFKTNCCIDKNLNKIEQNIQEVQNGQNTSYLKKQVRFESPTGEQCESVLPKQEALTEYVFQKSTNKNNTERFEDIYLSNIPNRNLDLSLLVPFENSERCTSKFKQGELHKKYIKEKNEKILDFPMKYKDFVSSQKEKNIQHDVDKNLVTDILNYGSQNRECALSTKVITSDTKPSYLKKDQCNDSLFLNKKFMPQSKYKENGNTSHFVRCDTGTQTIDCSNEKLVKIQDTNEPTMRDLLKIISQQNEQLIQLQKQVAVLMNKEQTYFSKDLHLEHVQYENGKLPNLAKRSGLPKFSIDMMASYEVSFKHQTMNNCHEPVNEEKHETDTCLIKSKNICYDKNENTCTDTSSLLKDNLDVREYCPSPDPSIKINMNDYESSDEEDLASDLETTFYKDLINQVNNILTQAQVQNLSEPMHLNDIYIPGKIKDKTMKKVKTATVKHLKSIGVNIPQLENEWSGFSNDSEDNSAKINLAVKQVLMKHLPDIYLSKISEKEQNPSSIGVITSRPEFSFATVQYMKKYNLISADAAVEAPHLLKKYTRNGSPKILDMTTLKQQPKLM